MCEQVQVKTFFIKMCEDVDYSDGPHINIILIE